MGLTPLNEIAPLLPRDAALAVDALRACGDVFIEEEILTAATMLQEALDGEYTALAAIVEGEFAGYCLAGRTPFTVSTWHLYWLCVHPRFHRCGVARALQSALEKTARDSGCERIVVETGGRKAYEPARRFYTAAGYQQCGRIEDYYHPGDACVFYCKLLS
ncbi:MAG: GNAT family N-acetyltransferase [Acidobacteria bacterium]|nr:GNAT family N-acetyltransferase [Acidobacteriota bacterium]